jgi:hypothetical protein
MSAIEKRLYEAEKEKVRSKQEKDKMLSELNELKRGSKGSTSV